MSTYVIVEEPGDWPRHADYLLTARTYLQHGLPTTGGRPRIINLCRSLEHLSAGYHCSPLAQARGHHCRRVAGHQPAATPSSPRQALAQAAGLAGPAERGQDPCAPYLRPSVSRASWRAGLLLLRPEPVAAAGADPSRGRHGWSVRQQESLSPLALSPSEKALMLQHAQAPPVGGRGTGGAALPARHPGGSRGWSRQQRCHPLALERFIQAAAAQGIRAEILALGHRAAAGVRHLWLRAETAVGHYTFEFARRAEQLKMPVIDSSRAILACSNKLYPTS